MNPRDISILDYTYNLPQDRIAESPLSKRDDSRLLIYKHGKINDDFYHNIVKYLPEDCLLVFNNTRVINARLKFKKPTGSAIEIFCLEPAGTIENYESAMAAAGSATWKCLVGGAAKWNDGPLLMSCKSADGEVLLKAEKTGRSGEAFQIRFSWEPALISFSEILKICGNIPLPPYIKRLPDISDSERYQTTYAAYPGSVAAPTAGLHFTQHIFDELAKKGIGKTEITLHVGAGTFKPVKSETMSGHEMHGEWISVTTAQIEQLANTKNIFAVGTTSLRTLESLYWMGLKVLKGMVKGDITVSQWDAYEMETDNVLQEESFKALAEWLKEKGQTKLFAQTSLMIVPGYKFRVVSGLITNFHQPGSTLLLLVAAATGDWKNIYTHAMENGYRFLSYGDGNLIFIDQG